MDYTVIQPNSELRACSRQQLKGVWGQMALAFLVYLLIYTPYFISSCYDAWLTYEDSGGDIGWYDEEEATNSPLTLILQLAMFVTSGAFALGFAGYFLKRVRGEEIAIVNIFDGFKRFFPALFLTLLTFLFIMLWSLLLLIPGIIKTLAYSMAYYIMHDNPKMTAREALKKSQIMMHGYKGKLFLLELSFIGWLLLGMLSFGIGLFWVYPYMYLTIANFYENLKHTQEKALVHDTPAPAAEETLTQDEQA
jgi:uncharacterized membrane protein